MSFRRPTLVICGNGAGAIALFHALASRPVMPLRVLVIGNGEPGEGVAYATRNPGHLLNTQAERMSIDPHQPDHFVRWLEKRNLSTGDWMGQFVPRLYKRNICGTRRKPPPSIQSWTLPSSTQRL